jgi:hypothetical protein
MTMFDHLPRPFMPGMVVPHQTGWAFTFCCNDGESYLVRFRTYDRAHEAKAAMRAFVAGHNTAATKEPTDEA